MTVRGCIFVPAHPKVYVTNHAKERTLLPKPRNHLLPVNASQPFTLPFLVRDSSWPLSSHCHCEGEHPNIKYKIQDLNDLKFSNLPSLFGSLKNSLVFHHHRHQGELSSWSQRWLFGPFGRKGMVEIVSLPILPNWAMKKTWLFGFLGELCYPIIYGLELAIKRVPLKQPAFHGK